jgi:DNA-3-methyladenine glycosylase II
MAGYMAGVTWMDSPIYKKVQRHLGSRDPVLKQLIRTVGACTLQHDSDHFAVLTRSIISQQISTRAALAIGNRLLEKVRKFQPKTILAASDEVLREAGLSKGKQLALRDLAEKCQDGTVPLKKLATMQDEAIVETLVQVRGIGPWTAEMFLIFSLGRLDVLPVGDFGLRSGIQKQYGLKDLPKKDALFKLAEPWQPYRSVGTWYIWRSLGNVPQSEE